MVNEWIGKICFASVNYGSDMRRIQSKCEQNAGSLKLQF